MYMSFNSKSLNLVAFSLWGIWVFTHFTKINIDTKSNQPQANTVIEIEANI